MFWGKKNRPSPGDAPACGHQLYQFLLEALQGDQGVRVEDLISVVATIVGERCIETAGDFPARTHTMAPGTRVFSDRINELLCGDDAGGDIAAIPAASVFGILRDRLVPAPYGIAEFPPLTEIFQFFAASAGNQGDWGKAPLSVPGENHPRLLPLRTGYESRAKVDAILAPLGADAVARLHATVLTLAEALAAVADAIDHRLVLRLAFETVNGMAKTAPMTDAAMAAAAKTPPS